jgi:hypothetical protein
MLLPFEEQFWLNQLDPIRKRCGTKLLKQFPNAVVWVEESTGELVVCLGVNENGGSAY